MLTFEGNEVNKMRCTRKVKRENAFCLATENRVNTKMAFKKVFLQNQQEKSTFHFSVRALRLVIGQEEALYGQ